MNSCMQKETKKDNLDEIVEHVDQIKNLIQVMQYKFYQIKSGVDAVEGLQDTLKTLEVVSDNILSECIFGDNSLSLKSQKDNGVEPELCDSCMGILGCNRNMNSPICNYMSISLLSYIG